MKREPRNIEFQNTTTNHVDNGSTDIQWTTHRKDMDAFDKLPKRLREALDNAPYSMSSEYVLDLVRGQGIAAAIREYQDSVDTFIGGKTWRPIRTISGSSSSPNGKRASAYRRRVNARTSSLLSALTIKTVAEC